MLIRDATIDDLAAGVVAGPGSVYAAQMTAALNAARAGNGVMLVAEIDERVIARVAMGYDPDAAYVFGLIVDPAHRRTGLASALMTEVETRAGAAGHDRVRLEVGKANTAAVRLYGRRGYGVVGSGMTCGLESRGRVIHAPEPVWIMERRLAADAE